MRQVFSSRFYSISLSLTFICLFLTNRRIKKNNNKKKGQQQFDFPICSIDDIIRHPPIYGQRSKCHRLMSTRKKIVYMNRCKTKKK